jgi:cobalt/nickel transport system permease protein
MSQQRHAHHHDELAEVALDDSRTLERENSLGNLNARTKVVLLGVALLANMLASSALTPGLLFLAAVGLLVKARVPRGTLLKRLMVPWYFAAVVFFTQLFFSGQSELFRIGPVVAYAEGMARGFLIASKVIGGTAAVLVVSMTTPMTGLLAAAAWLRVPRILVEIAALTYRFLFLLAEEAERIREAQKTRLGHSSWWNTVRSFSTLGGMVMINSYDRADRIYQSMLMRGYTGTMPLPEAEREFGRRDLAVVVAVATGLALSLYLGSLI